jgi:signal transduction histidine kinase
MNAFQSLDKTEKHITITTVKDEDKVRIIIKDNGKGIPAAIKAKIFQPFITGRKEGTGLGLAISYRIIREIHRGDIRIESVEGQGTEVNIVLNSELGARNSE